MTFLDDLEPPRQGTRAGGSGRSSADPNLLMQYAHGAHDLAVAVDAVLARLRSVSLPHGLRVALTPGDAAGIVARYDQDLVADADRTRRIAMAFAEIAGMTQLAQSTSVGAETWPIWPQGVAYATDDEVGARIQADITQETRDRADGLAEQFRTAVHNNDPAALKSLMATLNANANDPVYTTEFFQRLGPDDTYLFFEHLHDWGNTGFWNPDDPGNKYNDFLAPFDNALANAEPHLSDDFVNRLLHSDGDFRPRNVVVDILRWGTYDDRLLFPAADELIFNGRNDDGYDDMLATSLEALTRSPGAAARYLTGHTSVTGSNDDRFTQLLPFTSHIFAAEGVMTVWVDPSVSNAVTDALRASGGDRQSVAQLLTDIAHNANELSFYFKDGAAAQGVTKFVTDHVDVAARLNHGDRVQLIDTILTAPGGEKALIDSVQVWATQTLATASHGTDQDLEQAVTDVAGFAGDVQGRALKQLSEQDESNKQTFETEFGVVTSIVFAPLSTARGAAAGTVATFSQSALEQALGITGGFDTLKTAGQNQQLIVGLAKLSMVQQLMGSRPDLFRHDAAGNLVAFTPAELSRIVNGGQQQNDLFASPQAAEYVFALVKDYGDSYYSAWTAGWSGK